MQWAINQVNNWIARNDPTKVLYLGSEDLTELPHIPSSCQVLYCQYNKLTTLPYLPNCRTLYCYGNNLTILPQLPDCQILNCGNNKLKTLPELSNCEELRCDSNELRILPQLPNCLLLSCYYNKLISLPELPNCMSIFGTNSNKYLHINKLQAKKFELQESPDYNKYATIIQRNYKNYLRKKYHDMICQYLFKGPTSLVCLYI